MSNNNGKVVIVSAPSGAGKTTLVNNLVDSLSVNPNNIVNRVITYTTRLPRKNEEHGKDYYFITKEQFQDYIKQGFFLEWSNAYGNYYGTAKNVLYNMKPGEIRFIILDADGVRSVKKITTKPVFIWILPPSINELRKRLTLRGANTSESIEKRLSLAKKELSLEKGDPIFDHHIINDSLDVAVKQLIYIVNSYL